jgi:hypothetical protein
MLLREAAASCGKMSETEANDNVVRVVKTVKLLPDCGIGKTMNLRKITLLCVVAALFSGPAAAQSKSEPISPPAPVVQRPGGDDNKSRYEYTPENQPSWQYQKPSSEIEACYNEADLLREQIRELEQAKYELGEELRLTKNRLSALQKSE